MLLPAITGSGESDLVSARSACDCAVVVAVPVLLACVPSGVSDVATALLVMVVPPGVAASTCTTIWNCAVAPLATGPAGFFCKTTFPVPPTTPEPVTAPPPRAAARPQDPVSPPA